MFQKNGHTVEVNMAFGKNLIEAVAINNDCQIRKNLHLPPMSLMFEDYKVRRPPSLSTMTSLYNPLSLSLTTGQSGIYLNCQASS